MGKKFNKLEKHIEHEYEHMGFGKKRSEYIARATAGKVYREQMGCKHCGSMSHHTKHHHHHIHSGNLPMV